MSAVAAQLIVLLEAVRQWSWNKPPRLERAAALKDALVLLQEGDSLADRCGRLERTSGVIAMFWMTYKVLKRGIVPEIKEISHISDARRTVSPMAAGITAESLDRIDKCIGPPTVASHPLRLAVLNPGRSGLALLGKDTLMLSRLWAIAERLQALAIQVRRLEVGVENHA